MLPAHHTGARHLVHCPRQFSVLAQLSYRVVGEPLAQVTARCSAFKVSWVYQGLSVANADGIHDDYKPATMENNMIHFAYLGSFAYYLIPEVIPKIDKICKMFGHSR